MATSSSLYQKGKMRLLAVKKVFSISISGGKVRQQQLKQMAARDDNQANENEKTVDRNIKISLGLMGLSTVGSYFFVPLLPIAAAGSLYIFHPVFEPRKRRITTELLEVIGILSFIITGRLRY